MLRICDNSVFYIIKRIINKYKINIWIMQKDVTTKKRKATRKKGKNKSGKFFFLEVDVKLKRIILCIHFSTHKKEKVQTLKNEI